MKPTGSTILLSFTGIFMFLITCSASVADPGRYEQVLSGPGWRLWLDHGAVWANDRVYMPPVDLSKLPVNPPTCGWDRLNTVFDNTVDVPGTVEQHYWGAIGGSIPDVGGDYRGVSWWSRTFNLPA